MENQLLQIKTEVKCKTKCAFEGTLKTGQLDEPFVKAVHQVVVEMPLDLFVNRL